MSRLVPLLALLAGCIPEAAIGERLDADGDGAISDVFGGDDCDDADPDAHPGGVDAPGDDADQDCVGGAFCPDGDADADGVCDGADRCDGPDDADADGDTVPDACDACDLGDDLADLDADDLADACDDDQDGDGLADTVELAYGSDPRDADSDGDGLEDGVENVDGDETVDADETDATEADSDGDGACDGADVVGDCTGAESVAGTDPLDADSDDDGRPDAIELSAGTDPLDADSDDDGRCDGPRRDNDGDGVLPADACRWVWFVDEDAPAGGDGLTWATAFRSPPTYAVAGDNDVWVAEGTYTAVVAGAPVLAMGGGMRVYGGFAGGEATFAERPAPRRATVLDGDRDGSGGPSVGDSPHVVQALGGLVLDGFVLRHGNAADGGAGLFVDGASAMEVVDVVVEQGETLAHGGGVYARGSTLALRGCVVRDNAADGEGGGVYVEGGEVTLEDVEITGNEGARGGGLALRGVVVHVDDARVLGNSTFSGGGGGGVLVMGATVDGAGLRIEQNVIVQDVGSPPCSTATIAGGGGIYAAGGSTIDLDDTRVWKNAGDGATSGACISDASVVLRDARVLDNDADGVQTIVVLSGGALTLVGAHVAGGTVSMIDVDGADATLTLVDATIAQTFGVIAVNVHDAGAVTAIGTSFDGMALFANAASATVSHVVVKSAFSADAAHTVEYTAAPGLTGGTGNVALSGDPFVRQDLDGDGVPELFLKHAGLDGQTSDGPGVDAGAAAALDARLAPFGVDWRTGTTRTDGALDAGAPDLGAHVR